MFHRKSSKTIINSYYNIQQAFLFRISESILSISFDIKDTIILRIYINKKIKNSNQDDLNIAFDILKNKFTKKINFDIQFLENKPSLSNLDTLTNKFYLKNELIQEERNND